MAALALPLLLLLAAAAAQNSTQPRREQFRVIYEWNAIEFEWPSSAAREAALNTSAYVPKNVLISGINYYGGNLFLTMPRMLDGVPATLAQIPTAQKDTAPKLRPFPSWEMNEVGNCAALQFVQNVEVDRNGMLWILDNGRIGTMTPQPSVKCPPSLVLIDLKAGTNQMERIPFPADVVSANTSYLNDLVVDNRGGDYAYITDNSASDPGIVVFRRRDKRSWKLRDPLSMTSVEYASSFRINGTSVNLPVNIDGIALGPPQLTPEGVDRPVYYSPLSSFHLYSVNASVLQNDSLAAQGSDALRPYVRDVGTKASQTDGMKMDAAGVLYYGLVGNATIAEWNSSTDFSSGQRTIARDPNYIQWVDRFTFDDAGNVYVVVNRLYNFVVNKVSTNEVNYRILKSHTGAKSYVFAEVPTDGADSGASAMVGSVALILLARLLA